MRQALHAKRAKLRSVAGTGWLTPATIGVTVALHAADQEAAR